MNQAISLADVAEILRKEDRFFLDIDCEPVLIATTHWILGLERAQVNSLFQALLIPEMPYTGVWDGAAWGWEFTGPDPGIRGKMWVPQEKAGSGIILRDTELYFSGAVSGLCRYIRLYHGEGGMVGVDSRYVDMLGWPKVLSRRPGELPVALWDDDRLMAIILPIAEKFGSWFTDQAQRAMGDTSTLEGWLLGEDMAATHRMAIEQDPKRKASYEGQALAYVRALKYVKGEDPDIDG